MILAKKHALLHYCVAIMDAKNLLALFSPVLSLVTLQHYTSTQSSSRLNMESNSFMDRKRHEDFRLKGSL